MRHFSSALTAAAAFTLIISPSPARTARRSVMFGAGVSLAARPQLPNGQLIRTSAAGLFGWKIGIPANAFSQATFLEAVDQAHALGLLSIEGYSTQKVSTEIPRNLGPDLSPDEVSAVKTRLLELKVSMPAYHADSIGSGAEGRKLFEFARSLGVTTIVSHPGPDSLSAIDKLAGEYGIDVAIENRDRENDPSYWAPKQAMTTIEGHSKRIGIGADVGAWMQSGIAPDQALTVVSPRLMTVNLRDRSALGPAGRDVVLGTGSLNVQAFLSELGKLQRPESLVSPTKCGNCSRPLVGLKPIVITIDTKTDSDPLSDLSRSILSFEKAVQPAMGDFVDAISRVTPITSPDEVPAADRQKIEAALPRQAPAKPLKKRKLLVIDLCPAGGYYHTTVAYANLALELMAKYTRAYEPVFSNNLDNLKYPKIKEFDAVFLNSTVGEVFIDPDVLIGLIRFVREGGGLAGIHGATYASMDQPEFGELIGAQDGPHKVETATLKVEDPASPLTKGFENSDLTKEFGGKEFVHTDEFYHFLPTGPFSREKLHVLISIDVDKSDMTGWHVRPDNDYAMSWIKGYGKGRVFNCALGHTPALFETPALASYILAGIQFVLGDLPADTTPSARLNTKR